MEVAVLSKQPNHQSKILSFVCHQHIWFPSPFTLSSYMYVFVNKMRKKALSAFIDQMTKELGSPVGLRLRGIRVCALLECVCVWGGGGVKGVPLTLKFDRATLLFLKIYMRHEAYRHGEK